MQTSIIHARWISSSLLAYTSQFISYALEYLCSLLRIQPSVTPVTVYHRNHIVLKPNTLLESFHLWSIGYFGKSTTGRGWPKYRDLVQQKSNESVVLSLEEAFFLMHVLKCIKITQSVDEKLLMSEKDFWNTCCQNRESPSICFAESYAVYEYYRLRGWIVRSGTLYGVDFVLYEKGPGKGHSKYCVLICTNESWKDMTWTKLSGASRISSTVQKSLIICHISPKRKETKVTSDRILTSQDWDVKETILKRWVPDKSRD